MAIYETRNNCPRKVSGQYEPCYIEQEREPSDHAALGPEHGAGRNREQEKLGVIRMMTNKQHGKSCDRGERKPGSRQRKARPKSANRPCQQKRSACQITGQIVDERVIREGAYYRLKAYHPCTAMNTQCSEAGVVIAAVCRICQYIGVPFLHPERRYVPNP